MKFKVVCQLWTQKKKDVFSHFLSRVRHCAIAIKNNMYTRSRNWIGWLGGGIIGQHVAIVSTWRGPGGSTISLFILGALYYMHTSRHLFLKDLITRITMMHFVCFLFDHRFQWQLISFFLWLMSTCSPLKTQVERRSVHYFSILKKYVEMREGKKTCWHRAWWRTSCNMYQRIINDFIPSHHFSFFPRKKNTRNFCALAQRLLQLEATATTSARYIWLQLFLVSFTSYLFLDSQSAAYSNPTLF